MKFYCEYCKSYLTHDKPSVRKSHLQGKNHIKLYCNYYENFLKQNKFDNDSNAVDLQYIYRNSPGSEDNEEIDDLMLPPPQPLKSMSNPPPSVFFNEDDKQLIGYFTQYNER